jgi:peptidoglycan/xylan/chitin deacetylase (PgdA/CDA1 family)
MLDPHELESRRSDRARRRQVRRRRRVAIAVLAFVALVAVVAVAGSSGGSPGRTSGTAARAGAAAHQRAVARRHRRAEARRRRRAARNQATPPTDTRTGLSPPAGADATVPILMYHVINAPPAGAPFPELYVTQTEFADQMRALHDAGWTAVTMDQVWDAWNGIKRLPPGHPIVISFDNGYRSQYLAGYPVLRHYHWPGVENIQLTGLPRSQGGISSRQIQRLVAAGWELDTQGFSHADLPKLDPQALQHEVADARRVVQRRYGVPVHWFCYPSGHYDAQVVAQVRAAGYRGSTTVVPGWAAHRDDPYRLPRLRVVGGTTPQQLLTQIAAARHDAPAPPTYGA